MGKLKLNPIEDVINTIKIKYADTYLRAEEISIMDALGRTLAEDIMSLENIPAFNKSTVDGFAVTDPGCKEQLKLIGSTDMGHASSLAIKKGECVKVPTGGAVPSGTAAVVKIEHTAVSDDVIKIVDFSEMDPNIIWAGDDIKAGETALKEGTYIRAEEIGVLASLGISKVMTYAKPKVAIISTGDELIGIDETPLKGQIREINTYTLRALSLKHGLEVVEAKVIKDDKNLIRAELIKALDMADILLVSGGSSVGEKDYTAEILDEICSDGVLVSGMAIKPGKPTILAKHRHKAAIGLPGHPVSAMIVFRVLMRALLETYGLHVPPERKIKAVLKSDAYAARGRDTYQMVSLEKKENELVAVPTKGKSGMISLLSKSDGYIVVNKDPGIIKAGMDVEVTFLD